MNKVLKYNQTSAKQFGNEVYVDVKMESAPFNTSRASDPMLKYRIQRNVNVNAVKNSIRNIFTWIPGERILNPEFGNKLRLYLYEGITDFNVEKIVSEIRHCVLEWEPRVQIVEIANVSSIDETEDNTVHLQIRYTISGLTDEQFAYDFYTDKPV